MARASQMERTSRAVSPRMKVPTWGRTSTSPSTAS